MSPQNHPAGTPPIELVEPDPDAAFPLPHVELDELRASRRETVLLSYEMLDTAVWPDAAVLRRRADRMLDKGWRIGTHPEIGVRPPVRWEGHDRSVAFHLNAWNPLSLLLAAATVLEDARYLQAARAAAFDWLERYQRPLLPLRTNRELDETIGQREEFVWYDMGVAQRVYRIAFLLDICLRDDAIPTEALGLLLHSLYFHHAALARPGFFRRHNNHGLYQALGQWAAARRFEDLPAMAAYRDLGASRVDELYAAHFFPSGVHREHSPGYQHMMLETFTGARVSGLLADEAWEDRLVRMEEALAWMVQPDGRKAPIGDTDSRRLADRAGDRFRHPSLRYLASDGKEGSAPETGVRAYGNAGYVFARLLPPGTKDPAEASYLAQHAGFHSHTHKHADHLSFVWHDRGRAVVVDPGRYGYAGATKRGSELRRQGFLYSDPNRIYVESTRAHATVEVDGLDFPRMQVERFGSAIVHAGEREGIAFSECEARTYPGIRHRRILLLRPGAFLLCVDWLQDPDGHLHDFVQRFPFDPAWFVELEEGRAGCTHRDGVRLTIASLSGEVDAWEHARGEEEPRKLGWLSDAPRSLVPAPIVGLRIGGRAGGCFATLLAWGDDSVVVPADQRVSPTLTHAAFRWGSGGREHRLRFTRGVDRPFELAYEPPKDRG